MPIIPAKRICSVCFPAVIFGMAALASAAPAGDALRENPFPFPFAPRIEIYRDGWIDLNKNGKRDTYENPAAPLESRIDDLLRQMTLDEKIVQLVTLYGYPHVLKDKHPRETWLREAWKDGIANIDQHGCAFGSPRGDMNDTPARNAHYINNTQRFFIEQTRLGIPVDFTGEGIRGANVRNATSFPSPNGMGAMWDTALAREIGRITGAESRAAGYTNIYTPILDVARDQRWGRWEGTLAEDPFLVAETGKAICLGVQETGAAATPKHYVGYGENKGARGWDSRTDPHITGQAFEAVHFYPFKRVFKEAAPLGVMCCYNDINGAPVAGDRHLLRERLRGELGFRGYVVSDSGAVERLHTSHRVAASLKDAHRMRLEAGLNVWTNFSMPGSVVKWIRELVDEKQLPESVIDENVREVLRVKFLIGLFDRPYVDPAAAGAVVGAPEHQRIALQASRECLVLLKNDNAALPLDAGSLRKIAVIGPSANRNNYVPAHYGPSGFAFVSVLDGLKAQLAAIGANVEVAHAEGCKTIDDNWPDSELIPEEMTAQERADIADAVALAKTSDVAIVVLGDNSRTSGESRTRNNLDLPGRQLDLLRAVHATGKPVVLVLIHGRPASINWAQKNIPAILSASFPGAQGGTAIAEALLGKYNPGGKLNGTWPKTVGQIPMNFPAKPRSNDEPDTKNRAHIPGPLYPFGFGLSYTTFEYENPAVVPVGGDPAGGYAVSIDIRNTGAVAGDEVAQLYISHTQTPASWFDQMLRGFARVHLKPGEVKTITLPVPPEHLEIALDAQKWMRPSAPFEFRIGASSVDLKYRILIRDGKVLKSEKTKPADKTKVPQTLNPLAA